MKEVWKDIPDYEELYQISNFGRVKNFKRNKLITINNKQSYLKVILWKNNKMKNMLIHRILAIVFIKNPNNYPCINHKDGNKLNNSLNNLEWVTHSMNNKHAYDTGLKVKEGVFNEKDLINIKYMVNSGISQRKIANKLNVDRSTVQRVISGKTYKGKY